MTDDDDRIAFRADLDDPRQHLLDAWWRQHDDEAPTVVLRCGVDGCRKVLGELKSDGHLTLIRWQYQFGEATVEAPGDAPPKTFDRLRRHLYERDSHPLREVGDGRRVTRRYRADPVVRPIESLSDAVCPTHGVKPIPFPDDAAADLSKFVADTQPGSRRTYLLFREKPLES